MKTTATFPKLIRAILQFRDARDWKQFHTPRNLAAALSIEAAELQEALLWKSDGEVCELLKRKASAGQIQGEIADVLIYALLFCHECGIDPGTAVARKLSVNRRKYPVRLAKGNSRKYSELTSR